MKVECRHSKTFETWGKRHIIFPTFASCFKTFWMPAFDFWNMLMCCCDCLSFCNLLHWHSNAGISFLVSQWDIVVHLSPKYVHVRQWVKCLHSSVGTRCCVRIAFYYVSFCWSLSWMKIFHSYLCIVSFCDVLFVWNAFRVLTLGYIICCFFMNVFAFGKWFLVVLCRWRK